MSEATKSVSESREVVFKAKAVVVALGPGFAFRVGRCCRALPLFFVFGESFGNSQEARGHWGCDLSNQPHGRVVASANVGDYEGNFAWGHGGQLIVLVDDLNMVVVVTADPFYLDHGGDSWPHEKASLELVGRFIDSLSKAG